MSSGESGTASTSNIARNVGAILLAWVLAFVFVRLFAAAGVTRTAGVAAGAGVALALAVWFRAHLAAILIAIALAIGTAELLLVTYFRGAAPGAPTRWAIAVAAAIAITAGWMLGSRAKRVARIAGAVD